LKANANSPSHQLLDEDKLHWLDDFEPFCRGPLKVIGSPNNEALLAATQWVIGNSTMDLVLFLEKDWQILETAEATTKRLDDGERRPNQEMQNIGFDGLSTVTLIMRRVVLCLQYLRREIVQQPPQKWPDDGQIGPFPLPNQPMLGRF
jgi:hypothetical protein